MIEYLAPNGKAWNPYTGCLHTQQECPTADKCWARTMSRRFKAVCGGDFQPRMHLTRLEEPLHWRKPYRIATCFMGDLFGPWHDAEDTDMRLSMFSLRWDILSIVRQCPQHTFLFLTKNPAALAEWNPWPANAWVGCSITGAESEERQGEMLQSLAYVEGGKRWLSYEPVLGNLELLTPNLDWLVIGAQTGAKARKPHLAWIEPIIKEADRLGIKIWVKKNLYGVWPGELRQELL